MLLTGCNSEGAFSEIQSSVPDSDSDSEHIPSFDAKVMEIIVTPSPIIVLKGHTQQLSAMAKYDDETAKDVSNSATWTIVGDPTIADISASGIFTANNKGDTEFTASMDGIVSVAVNANVCDLADPCIDIFDTGHGKLITNSPSVAYLDSIGGSATSNVPYTESGTNGPTGDFYRFDWNAANILCDTYNINSIGGRTNWRLPTRDELKVELFDVYGHMFTARGWPAERNYWSMTPDGPNYYIVSLRHGGNHGQSPAITIYTSCVSEP